MSTPDHLKLYKASRRVVSDKLIFFETSRKIWSDFKLVYTFYMRIKALSKALVFFNTRNVFQIMPKVTVTALKLKLNDLFTCQKIMQQTEATIYVSPTDPALLAEEASASSISTLTTQKLQV